MLFLYLKVQTALHKSGSSLDEKDNAVSNLMT